MATPKVPDEYIRLWRGIPSKPDGDVGEYWTVYRALAEEYMTDDEGEPVDGATLFYLDLRIDVAVQYRSVGRAPGEFILPRELANCAVCV